MKITREMLDYWYGSLVVPKEISRDLIDIANGEYTPKVLKNDIINTWGGRDE